MCAAMAKPIVRASTKGLDRLPPLPSLRDLVKLYKLKGIKQLSQNFLLDMKLTNKIAKVAGADLENIYTCEVGPGPGGITRSILAKGAKKVILIEKDRRFEPMIKMLSSAYPGRVEFHWGDVLSFNLSTLFPEEARVPWESENIPPIRVLGNLPFNVATPLIIKWLKCISNRSNVWTYGRVPLILTFQKEVAERMVADIMDNQRSRLSIMAQYLTHCDLKFIIRGSSFVPKPDVDVGVVKFIPRQEPLINQSFDVVEKVVRQMMNTRRQRASKGAGKLFPRAIRPQLTERLFQDARVPPETAPMQVSVEEVGRLCDAYVKICEEYPVSEYNNRGVEPDLNWELKYGEIYGYGNPSEEQFARLEKERRKRVQMWEHQGKLVRPFDYDYDELEASDTDENNDELDDHDDVVDTLETCQINNDDVKHNNI